MIGYNCKYAPTELMAGFGEKCSLINNEVSSFDYSAGRLHPNMCSHAKAMLEEIHTGAYDKLLFMNCCDSSKRVFDAVKNESISFSYCIDLPSCNNGCAVERLKNDLLDFISGFESFSGKTFDKALFLSAFAERRKLPGGKYIAVLGARSSETLTEIAKKCFPDFEILDLTCANSREVMPIDADENDKLDELMTKYAKALTAQIPCMRMQDIRAREALLDSENCVGIIYSTIKFCDYYDFEFSRLKNLKRLP